MAKRLILAGAGHAHLCSIMNIPDFIRAGYSVTVVSADDFHYYSGMGPGLLTGLYTPNQTRFAVRIMAENRGAEFITGCVSRIDADEKRIILDDGRMLDYDVLSCNLGSFVSPLPSGPSAVIPVKPIENLYTAGRALEHCMKTQSLRVLVVGGGPAGVEIAGNLEGLAERTGGSLHITLVSQSPLLERFMPRVRGIVAESFARRKIRILENATISHFTETKAILESGETIAFDKAFNATGIRPSGVFRRSGIPTGQDGGLLVNKYLQCVNYPDIYGAGDCIAFAPRPLDRVGVYAVRQGPILYANLQACLSGAPLTAFRPQHRYLSILNLGDGRGVAVRGAFVYNGRLAFRLKDFIDRMFMRRFPN